MVNNKTTLDLADRGSYIFPTITMPGQFGQVQELASLPCTFWDGCYFYICGNFFN